MGTYLFEEKDYPQVFCSQFLKLFCVIITIENHFFSSALCLFIFAYEKFQYSTIVSYFCNRFKISARCKSKIVL